MSIKLPSKEITGARAGPQLLITGGVHGDEFEPMEAVRRLMRQIDPAELAGSVTLVPVVNEAAFASRSRVADADGLDLARVCPGRADGSVTEQAAYAVSELIRAADYFIDLHTGGTTMAVWPLAGYTLHADHQVRATQRRMAEAFNLPIVWGTDPSLDGRTLSVARDAGVPAIYAEFWGGGRCDECGVAAYVEGCLNVMAELEMIDRPRAVSRVEHVVEDDRESAGHMQICNPAPAAGFFSPAVELGASASAGDLLGTVYNALGNEVAEVHLAQSGIILVLRTFPRVEKDDSLAVVLELPE